MSKYLSVKYLLISKKLAPSLRGFHFVHFYKIPFLGPILGGFPGEWPQIISGDKIVFATEQLHKKIRFRCFVVYEKKSVQNIGRKKRKTKEK